MKFKKIINGEINERYRQRENDIRPVLKLKKDVENYKCRR